MISTKFVSWCPRKGEAIQIDNGWCVLCSKPGLCLGCTFNVEMILAARQVERGTLAKSPDDGWLWAK